MSKPRLFVRDWKPIGSYKELEEYFDVDIFDMVAGEVLEYDGFLLHHFSYDEDMEPLKRVWGEKPIVIEVMGGTEKRILLDELFQNQVDINDISIGIGAKDSHSKIYELFGIDPA